MFGTLFFGCRGASNMRWGEASLAEASTGDVAADHQVTGGKSASAPLHELVQQNDGDIPKLQATPNLLSTKVLRTHVY